jgi:hypothetical protein
MISHNHYYISFFGINNLITSLLSPRHDQAHTSQTLRSLCLYFVIYQQMVTICSPAFLLMPQNVFHLPLHAKDDVTGHTVWTHAATSGVCCHTNMAQEKATTWSTDLNYKEFGRKWSWPNWGTAQKLLSEYLYPCQDLNQAISQLLQCYQYTKPVCGRMTFKDVFRGGKILFCRTNNRLTTQNLWNNDDDIFSFLSNKIFCDNITNTLTAGCLLRSWHPHSRVPLEKLTMLSSFTESKVCYYVHKSLPLDPHICQSIYQYSSDVWQHSPHHSNRSQAEPLTLNCILQQTFSLHLDISLLQNTYQR